MKLIIEEEVEAFLRALDPRLLNAIVNSGDSISLGYVLNKKSVLIEITLVLNANNSWDVRIDYYKLLRGLLKVYAPELFESKSIKLGLILNQADNALGEEDVRENLNYALKVFTQPIVKSIIKSKEPLTFGYDDRQVEVAFNLNADVSYTVYID